MKAARPTVGQLTTCHGLPARIIKVHPFGTIDVVQIATGRAYRITGLAFL